MRFQPLVTIWILLPIAVVGFVALGYLLFKLWKIKSREFLSWVRRAVMFLLLILLAAGTSIPGGSSSPGVANLDVLFAVDTTSSMGAQDYSGTKLRLDGVKQDMLALAEKMRGAHMAIITFDSKANVALPFTSDTASFNAAVQSLQREVYGTSKGSAIDKPVEAITQQLKNSQTAHPERNRLLFYLSDGEQTSKDKIKPFSEVTPYVNGGAVLGYGTAVGAKMLRYTGLEDDKGDKYVNMLDPATKKFVPAVSKLDESALKKISSELKISYHNRNAGGTVDSVYATSKAQVLIDQSKKIVHYINLYWLFAIPLVGLLFWEWHKVLLMVIQYYRDERKHRA